jgi:hypothetical protein
MTLVFSNSGALQQLQLGINEISSAFVVGKTVGSAFSRSYDASVFDVLEKNLEFESVTSQNGCRLSGSQEKGRFMGRV